MKRSLLIVIVILLAVLTAGAETYGNFQTQVRGRRIDFDLNRLPDSIIMQITNDAAILVATVGKTNEQDSLYDFGTDSVFALPSDLYLTEALTAIRTGDPNAVMTYVARKELGKNPTTTPDYPTQFSIWNDSLILNMAPPQTGMYGQLSYYRLPVAIDSTADTIDIPDIYLPLLKEMVITMCDDRIRLASERRTDTEARLRFYEQKLLGRPTDAK